MKKVLVGALALMMLCGCGGDKKEGSSTVCRGNVEGQDMEMTMNFDGDDKVTEVKVVTSVDVGDPETAEMTKNIMDSQKETILGDFKDAGEVMFEVDGAKVKITITLDVAKVPNGKYEDFDFSATKDEIIAAAQQSGFTCE